MTHSDLVKIAYKWLMAQNCGFAFMEIKACTLSGEIPDAIGFKSDCTILIECKASRADFLADKKKYFRVHPEAGMGDHRFFMAPKGMIAKDELPEGWGLIVVNEKGKARRVHGGPGPGSNMWYAPYAPFKGCRQSEQAMMYSALRRLHIRGRIPEIYGNPYDAVVYSETDPI